jgi:hypothetical protein
MNIEKIKNIVWVNLQSAKENDYFFDGWTDEEIAHDLQCFAEDCSELNKYEMLPHIAEWRRVNEK